MSTDASLQPTGLTIGSLRLPHPFFLAPMAGLTTPALRLLARHFGASLCYTEMLLAGFVTRGDPRDDRYPRIDPADRPIGVQLCGNDPRQMAEAARHVDEAGFDLVDLNMACPVRKVGRKGYGGFLLRDPDLALRLIEAVRPHVHRPLTIKIRAGFEPGDRSYIDFARRAVQAGVDAIALHARTVRQQYTGPADWSRIAELKHAVSVPVFGSGDLFTADAALRMLRQTGADAALIARGALGSPWIFRDLLSLWHTGRPAPPLSHPEMIQVMHRHLDLLLEHTGPERAVRLMRRASVYYSRKLGLGKRFRQRLMQAASPPELHRLLDDCAARCPA